MLECMRSLSNRRRINNYSDEDETYILFEKVLAEYLPFTDTLEMIKVSAEHDIYFKSLDELYSISKSEPCNEWNQEEKMADSLAWYKATGLIVLKEGSYYINSEKLKNKQVEYNQYNSSKGSLVKKA